ncbi:MAG: bis(5'-nucleosyl)-tetraphosphatase [Candidatus Woesearchaeota archaeon]
MKQIHSCGIIVFRLSSNDKPEYLLIRSAKGKIWGFPKGKQEHGEDDLETAKREVYEETGVKATIMDGFKEDVYYRTGKGNQKRLSLFLAEATTQDITLKEDEIDAYLWLSYEDALEQITYKDLAAPLGKAHKLLMQLQSAEGQSGC